MTIWIPIFNSIPGATFYADHKKDLNNYIDIQDFDLDQLKIISEKISHKG